jgi:probable HAF family extracellular repeat protein
MRGIMRMARHTLSASALAWLSLWAAPSEAIEYRFADLGSIEFVSNFGIRFLLPSHGESVNEFGDVAGWSSTKGIEVQAKLYRGSWVDLGEAPGIPIAPTVVYELPYDKAYGVNNHGVVTGTSYDSFLGGSSRAFLYDGATMHDLGTLNVGSSEGRDINSSNQVVGWSTFARGSPNVHAFLHDGTMHDLGTLGGTNSRGYGINDLGSTTGSSQIPGDVAEHAFRHDGTMMHDLGTLGGTNSYGQDINIHGLVTGYSDLTSALGDQHAFLHDGTMMHDLGTLGGNYSAGFGVNNHGYVVGESLLSNGDTRAFVYTSHKGIVDLNSLVALPAGFTLLAARDINDAGQILAEAYGPVPFGIRAFLLTPVPEPSTLALAVVLAAGWIADPRRNKPRLRACPSTSCTLQPASPDWRRSTRRA